MPTNHLSAAQLADLTPPTRDRYVDFLRALAIVAVVIGHLVVADVRYGVAGFSGHNALGDVAALRWATLVFQVMPLFFVVGGYANAASWASARRRGVGSGGWLHSRLSRLARPAGAFVVVWTLAVIVLAGIGADDLAATAGRLVVFPLWFLPVYVVAISAAPALWRAQQRWGGRVAGLLLGAVVVTDLLRFAGGVPFVGLVNMVLVWLAFQQVGFCWHAGLVGSARDGRRLLAAAGAALVALVVVGPYAVDMVSAPGRGASNTAPPTVALLVFGLAQFGLALAARGPVTRWLERPPVWAAVIALNARAMTLYLWHFTAIVLAAVVVLPAGIAQPAAGTGTWWWLRPVWLAAELTLLVGLTAAVGRWERGWPGAPVSLPRALSIAGLLTAGFVALTTQGFWPDGQINWLSSMALGVATVLLVATVTTGEPTVGGRGRGAEPETASCAES